MGLFKHLPGSSKSLLGCRSHDNQRSISVPVETARRGVGFCWVEGMPCRAVPPVFWQWGSMSVLSQEVFSSS